MISHKGEEALSGAGRLLRSYADASLDAIYVKDRQSRWLFANPALERITRKSSADLLGKTDSEIYSNREIGEAILANDRKVMESGKPETFEEFVDLPDGRHFFISVKSPRFDEKGNVNGLLGISHDITNRKRREEQLRESQQKYKALIETTSDFVWEIDPRGLYTYCSPQMETLWGIEPNEMIGKSPFDKMPPEARDEGINLFQSWVASEKPFNGVQIPSLDGQGKLIFIEVSGVPFFDDSGKLLGYRGITRDITERKKAEEALRSSKALLESVFANMNEGVVFLDNKGNIIDFNEAFALVTRFKNKEETLRSIGSFASLIKAYRLDGSPLPVEEWPAVKALQGQSATNQEFIIERTDTGERWISSNSYAPLRNERREIVGAVQTTYDITERKKAEERVSQSQKTFYELVERAPFGIYIVDSKFCVSHMNVGSQNGAFKNVRPIIGRPFSEAIHILWPDDVAEEIISHFRHTLETGEPYYSPRFTNPRHDVEIEESYEWELQRMTLPDGQKAVVCYYFDSTKLRDTEKALIEARDELKKHAVNLERLVEERTKQLKDSERLAAIGATAGMVGHDIRNPLQAIRNDVYLLRSDVDTLPKGRRKKDLNESLTGIEQNVRYIDKIVRDLQDFASPLSPNPDEVNLHGICEDALLENSMPRTIKASCRVDEDAKQIVTDPELLKRVINNLVSNAVQAMPNGGILSVNARRDGKDIVIEVQDSGGGIPEEVKPRLFTPLFTTKSKGQGFGLAVVKRVTEAMNGVVSFESEAGKGTKFIIRLPTPKAENGKWVYSK